MDVAMVFLQSKIRMKISTTVSAPWQPDFPAFVFLFPAPLCISLLLPTSHHVHFTHTPPSSDPVVSTSSSFSYWLGNLCSDPSWPSPHWFLASFLPTLALHPALPTHYVMTKWTWASSYHTLDKMLAGCHPFWLQRCPRLGKFLRCTWWQGKESPDGWKTSEKVQFLWIFPKLHQCSQ